MEKSELTFRQITIQEYYTKDDDGIVWWHYRVGGRPWIVEKTYFVDIPFVDLGKD